METTMVKTKWKIDPAHSEIQFKARHLVISTVTGSFSKFEGNVHSSSDDFSDAEIEFAADVESINTNQSDRDAHLRSPEFFDVENYPKLTFKSREFRKKGDNTYILDGDLTIKNITRPVTFDAEYGGIVKDPWGNMKAGFEINGKINRKEFGLTWNAVNEAGNLVVADEIKIQINVELVKEDS